MTNDTGMALLFFRLILSLAAIICLIWFVIKFIKKQQDLRQKAKENERDWISVHDYQALGPGKGIYLLTIFSKSYAVAMSEHSISVICETDSNETDSNEADSSDGFEDHLKNQLQKQHENQMESAQRLLAKLTKGGTEIEK